jgi:putative membrane protein
MVGHFAAVTAAAFPRWNPHADVWLVVGLLVAGYWIALARLGPRFAPDPQRPASRFQLACFGLGMIALWVASDWPIHDIAEGHNYSMHMVQHLTYSLIAVPLLILGTPGWLARCFLRPGVILRTVQVLARFFPALIVFNLVLVFTHWPALVRVSLGSGVVHFGVHALVIGTSLLVWMPVLSPLPEVPRLTPPLRAVFLFLQSIVPTVPASFLTFGSMPLYRAYERFPHLWGLTPLEDQRLAGLIMKIGAGILLWAIIAVIFFRWAADEERRNLPRRVWQDLDDTTMMGPPAR